jgi:hypothetical protein
MVPEPQPKRKFSSGFTREKAKMKRFRNLTRKVTDASVAIVWEKSRLWVKDFVMHGFIGIVVALTILIWPVASAVSTSSPLRPEVLANLSTNCEDSDGNRVADSEVCRVAVDQDRRRKESVAKTTGGKFLRMFVFSSADSVLPQAGCSEQNFALAAEWLVLATVDDANRPRGELCQKS